MEPIKVSIANSVSSSERKTHSVVGKLKLSPMHSTTNGAVFGTLSPDANDSYGIQASSTFRLKQKNYISKNFEDERLRKVREQSIIERLARADLSAKRHISDQKMSKSLENQVKHEKN